MPCEARPTLENETAIWWAVGQVALAGASATSGGEAVAAEAVIG